MVAPHAHKYKENLCRPGPAASETVQTVSILRTGGNCNIFPVASCCVINFEVHGPGPCYHIRIVHIYSKTLFLFAPIDKQTGFAGELPCVLKACNFCMYRQQRTYIKEADNPYRICKHHAGVGTVDVIGY